MTDNDIERIGIILGQFGGPISISTELKNRCNISTELINYHKNKYTDINGYSRSDYFSLFYIVQFVLNDLGDDEFNLVTGMNLYTDGYTLLNKLKKKI